MPETRVPEKLTVKNAPLHIIKFVAGVIEKYHKDLDPNRILVVFTSKEMTTKGKRALAKMGTASPMVNIGFAAGAGLASADGDGMDRMVDFIMTIDQEIWFQLQPPEQEALIDHELCHAYYDDKDKPKIVTHDFEEFTEVVERHGMWTAALNKLKKVLDEKAQVPVIPSDTDQVAGKGA